MLDMVRYMVVWQPTIMTVLHFVFHLLHMDGETIPSEEGDALSSASNQTSH